MHPINTLTSMIDSGIVWTNNVCDKISASPFAFKKASLLLSQIIEIWNDQKGIIHFPELVRDINCATELIDFYATFKNIVYWLNPFDVKKLDKAAFIDSLRIRIVRDPIGQNLDSKVLDAKLNAIFAKVVSDSKPNSNLNEVRRTLKKVLKEGLNGIEIESKLAVDISQTVKIQIQPRMIISLLKTACFTLADFGTNLQVCQRWNLVNLAQLANTVGTEIPLFSFVTKTSISYTKIVFACVGLSLSIIETLYKLLLNDEKLMARSQNEAEEQQTIIDRGNHEWDLVSSSLDLLGAGLPLMMDLNPQMILALSFIANGTGLIAVFFKN